MTTTISSNKTELDRRIVVTLPPDHATTASRRDGISAAVERLHRLHGTSLLRECLGEIDSNASSCFPTACALFHRYCHQVSLRKVDVWTVALGALLLAAKLEEQSGVCHAKQILSTFLAMYRRRKTLERVVNEERNRLLRHPGVVVDQRTTTTPATLTPLGPVWQEWHQNMMTSEGQILCQLGFTLHWIPSSHPHRYILYFLRVLVDSNNQPQRLAQAAWDYCNDSCRLDLSLRYSAPVIACAALYLAALDNGVALPHTATQPWWKVFCGPGNEQDMADMANALLGLRDEETNTDVLAAGKGYLKSLLPGDGSFADPASFSWEAAL